MAAGDGAQRLVHEAEELIACFLFSGAPIAEQLSDLGHGWGWTDGDFTTA
jgi:hypothetical protein